MSSALEVVVEVALRWRGPLVQAALELAQLSAEARREAVHGTPGALLEAWQQGGLAPDEAGALLAAFQRRVPREGPRAPPDPAAVAALERRRVGGWSVPALSAALGRLGLEVAAASLHAVAAGAAGRYPADLAATLERVPEVYASPEWEEARELHARVTAHCPDVPALESALAPWPDEVREALRFSLGNLAGGLGALLDGPVPAGPSARNWASGLRLLWRFLAPPPGLAAFVDSLLAEARGAGQPAVLRTVAEVMRLLLMPEAALLDVLAADLAAERLGLGDAPLGPALSGGRVLVIGGEKFSVAKRARLAELTGAAEVTFLPASHNHSVVTRVRAALPGCEAVVALTQWMGHSVFEATVDAADRRGTVVVTVSSTNPERIAASVNARLAMARP